MKIKSLINTSLILMVYNKNIISDIIKTWNLNIWIEISLWNCYIIIFFKFIYLWLEPDLKLYAIVCLSIIGAKHSLRYLRYLRIGYQSKLLGMYTFTVRTNTTRFYIFCPSENKQVLGVLGSWIIWECSVCYTGIKSWYREELFSLG